MQWLIADWGPNKRHVFDGVEKSLRALGHEIRVIPRNDSARQPELVQAIASARFDVLLTWQRFYPMQRPILTALAGSPIKTLFMDFGFVPHYQSVVFDTSGENAASSWPQSWTASEGPAIRDTYLATAEELMKSAASRARMLAPPPLPAFDHVRLPFVFVPLQRPKDSVVRYDSSVRDLGALLRRVLFLARGRFFVVCKTHPLDRGLDLGVPDRVEGSHVILRESFGGRNEEVCDYLLSHAAMVIGINSNMLFRATVFGTPVIATGRGWYSGSRAIHEVDGVDQLRSLEIPLPQPDAQRRYLAMCLSRQLLFSELADPAAFTGILQRVGLQAASEAVCS